MFLGSGCPSLGSSSSDAGLCSRWLRRVIQRNHILKGTRRECCERKLIGSPFFLR